MSFVDDDDEEEEEEDTSKNLLLHWLAIAMNMPKKNIFASKHSNVETKINLS